MRIHRKWGFQVSVKSTVMSEIRCRSDKFMSTVSNRFSGCGIWFILEPGSGIGSEKRARFGIVMVIGTREFAILRVGIREMVRKRTA